MNYLCKLTDVENDDAIVTNSLRRIIQTASRKNGPLIIIAAVSRLHLLSERVLSLFSYTLAMPVSRSVSTFERRKISGFSLVDFHGNTKRMASKTAEQYFNR